MSGNSIDAGTIGRGRLTYFPVVPGRLEFASRVRRYILERRPQLVAVELPGRLERIYERALARLPQMSVILIPEGGASTSVYSGEEEQRATSIPVEPCDPFVEALRTAREIGASTMLLEPATHERPHLAGSYAEPYAVESIGMERYVEAFRVHPPARTPEIDSHAAAMAWKLQGADPLAEVLVVVSLNLLDPLLDAIEAPQEEPPRGRIRLFDQAELFNLHPDCLAEVTSEAPYFQELYEKSRSLAEPPPLDRPRWQLALMRDAEKEYHINTGETMQSWQRRMLARFTRNLSLLDGRLVAGVYDMALGGRSIVDDNFAWEVWQMANRYSMQQSEDPPLETIELSGEEVWAATRKLRIRRRLPRMKQMWKPVGLKPHKREKVKGEWAAQTDGESICSYPPEDLVIENYGRFVKKYAKTMLSEERSRVEPFTTSMRDGIDRRETIRKWHEGKIYVRETEKLSGEVGAVVIIFDEDRENRYTYLTTWLGEHQNESDMAFYSTHPFEHLVGPGIGRAEYGGLLMTLPPRRMFSVWDDADYDTAETKAERLLMAGLDYSMDRYVVYAAARPPRSVFRAIAARVNRKIVYLPLGQLSPAKLKKIRVLHVLENHRRRQDAGQYIW
jgi:hypothetical protein